MEKIWNFLAKIKGYFFQEKIETKEHSNGDLFVKHLDYLREKMESGEVTSNFISKQKENHKTDAEPPKKQIYLSKTRNTNIENLKLQIKFEEKPIKDIKTKAYFNENCDKNNDENAVKRKILSKKKTKENPIKIPININPIQNAINTIQNNEKNPIINPIQKPSQNMINHTIQNNDKNPIIPSINPIQKPSQNMINPPINTIQNNDKNPIIPSINPIQKPSQNMIKNLLKI